MPAIRYEQSLSFSAINLNWDDYTSKLEETLGRRAARPRDGRFAPRARSEGTAAAALE